MTGITFYLLYERVTDAHVIFKLLMNTKLYFIGWICGCYESNYADPYF